MHSIRKTTCSHNSFSVPSTKAVFSHRAHNLLTISTEKSIKSLMPSRISLTSLCHESTRKRKTSSKNIWCLMVFGADLSTLMERKSSISRLTFLMNSLRRNTPSLQIPGTDRTCKNWLRETRKEHKESNKKCKKLKEKIGNLEPNKSYREAHEHYFQPLL